MDASIIFNHYKTLIDNLLDNSEFFPYFFQNPRDFGGEIIGNNNLYNFMPKNLGLFFGCTRACLIDDTYPYVIKIEYEDSDIVFSDNKTCCEREANFYSKAKNFNCSQYFTEIIDLGFYEKTINSYPLYQFWDYYDCEEFDIDCFEEAILNMEKDNIEKQNIHIKVHLYGYERAESISHAHGTLSKNKVKKLRTKKSPLAQRNTEIAARFVKDYGWREYYRFSNFLKSEKINDIHFGNVGEIENKIVIIDYAGYPSEER